MCVYILVNEMTQWVCDYNLVGGQNYENERLHNSKNIGNYERKRRLGKKAVRARGGLGGNAPDGSERSERYMSIIHARKSPC